MLGTLVPTYHVTTRWYPSLDGAPRAPPDPELRMTDDELLRRLRFHHPRQGELPPPRALAGRVPVPVASSRRRRAPLLPCAAALRDRQWSPGQVQARLDAAVPGAGKRRHGPPPLPRLGGIPRGQP